MRAYGKMKGVSDLARKACPRPWVALETTTGLQFVEGITDYSSASGDETKGVVVRFFCDVGEVYVVCTPLPRGGKRIIKAKVNADGSLQEIIGN